MSIITNRSRLTTIGYAASLFGFDVGEVKSATPSGLPDAFATRIIQFLGAIAIPLALVAIVYSAFVLINSAGNPDAMVKAKKNIGYLVTGLALILFARILFNFVTGLFK